MVAIRGSASRPERYSLVATSRYSAGALEQPTALIAICGGNVVDAAGLRIGRQFCAKIRFEADRRSIETMRLRGRSIVDGDVNWHITPLPAGAITRVEVLTLDRVGVLAGVIDVFEAHGVSVASLLGDTIRANSSPEYFRTITHCTIPKSVDLSGLEKDLLTAANSFDSSVSFEQADAHDPLVRLSTGWAR